MTPNDRELSLYAKIEKLEKCLAIAKEALRKIDLHCSFESIGLKQGCILSGKLSRDAREQIKKELGE